jgi:hypothetical protein
VTSPLHPCSTVNRSKPLFKCDPSSFCAEKLFSLIMFTHERVVQRYLRFAYVLYVGIAGFADDFCKAPFDF